MKKLSYSFSLLILFFTCCKGQVKTDTPSENSIVPKTISLGQPKIIKTQGSNEFENIFCGLQDKNGNIWFGTTGEGAYRYDGKLFTQFTVKDGLKNNTIWSILEDKAGNIWFGTDDGACCYDGKTFTNFSISVIKINNLFTDTSENKKPSAKNAVWSMLQDNSGKIWFGTSDGVYSYNGTFFSHFLDNDSINNKDGLHLKMIDCILQDQKGIIWFASGMPPGGEGICSFDGRSISGFKPDGNGWIRTILEEKNGNLLFATRHSGLLRYDRKNLLNISQDAGIDNSSVWSILEDKAGNIWIGTELGSGELGEDGGLWRYDGKYFTKFTTKDGLSHNGVSFILEDRNGKIWVGTRNVGLCRYDPDKITIDGRSFTVFSE